MSNESTTAGSGLSRRAFLGASGALLGSTLLMGPNPLARDSALAKFGAAQRGSRVPLAYLSGTEGATSAEVRALVAAGGARAVPAASLRSGGASSARDAMAHVRIDPTAIGLSGSGVKRAQLDALVEADGSTLVPFYAWTYSAGPGTVHTGGNVQFAVPFERQPSVGLALRTSADSKGSWSESGAVLTGGADPGMAKLREGAYLLGLDQRTFGGPVTLPPAEDPAWGSVPSLLLTVHAI